MITVIPLFYLFFTTLLPSAHTSCTSIQYYDFAAAQCKPCDPSCKTCFGPSKNHCSSCLTTMTLNHNSCSCPLGTYYSLWSRRCRQCSSTCKVSCTGPRRSQCSACPLNKFQYQGTCYPKCLATEYFDIALRSCKPCHSSCYSCTGPSSTQCTTHLISETLVFDACDDSCLTCSGPGTNQCASCSADMTLINGECVDKIYNGICDATCSSCSGPDIDECLTCHPGDTLKDGRCIQSSGIECHESCAKCVNCLVNGCTSCQNGHLLMETQDGHGFCYPTCPAGYIKETINGVAVCQTRVKLSVTARCTPDPTKFIIRFDKNIANLYPALTSQLSVAINFQQSQPDLNYSYSFSLSDSQSDIIVQLSYDGYLLAANTLIVKLADTASINSTLFMLDNTELEYRIPEYYKYSDSAQKAVKIASAFTQVGFQANGVYSLVSSTVFKSIHSIRSELIDSMLNFFIFMNIDFPPNFVDFAQGTLQAMDTMVPNLLTGSPEHRNDSDDSDEENKYNLEQTTFDRYLSRPTFFDNYGNNLSLFIIALGIMLAVEIILKTLQKMNKKGLVSKLLVHISCSLRWNLIVSELISSFQESTFFTMLSFKSNVSPGDVAGAAIMLCFLVIGIVLINLFSKKFVSNHNKKENSNHHDSNNNMFYKRLAVLHDSIKPERLINFMILNFFIIRSLGFSLLLVFAYDIPTFQLIYLLVSTSAFIFFLIKYAPIKKKIQLIVTLIYEVMFLTAVIITLILNTYNQHHLDDIETRNIMGFILICIATSMTFINIANSFLELSDLRDHFRKKKKATVTPCDSLKNSVVESTKRDLLIPGFSELNSPSLDKTGLPISPSETISLKEQIRIRLAGSKRSMFMKDPLSQIVPVIEEISSIPTLTAIYGQNSPKAKTQLMSNSTIKNNFRLDISDIDELGLGDSSSRTRANSLTDDFSLKFRRNTSKNLTLKIESKICDSGNNTERSPMIELGSLTPSVLETVDPDSPFAGRLRAKARTVYSQFKDRREGKKEIKEEEVHMEDESELKDEMGIQVQKIETDGKDKKGSFGDLFSKSSLKAKTTVDISIYLNNFEAENDGKDQERSPSSLNRDLFLTKKKTVRIRHTENTSS